MCTYKYDASASLLPPWPCQSHKIYMIALCVLVVEVFTVSMSMKLDFATLLQFFLYFRALNINCLMSAIEWYWYESYIMPISLILVSSFLATQHEQSVVILMKKNTTACAQHAVITVHNE